MKNFGKEEYNMKISRTHYYTKEELKALIRELQYSPLRDIAVEIKEYLDVKNQGEYLMNIIREEDIHRVKEYVEG